MKFAKLAPFQIDLIVIILQDKEANLLSREQVYLQNAEIYQNDLAVINETLLNIRIIIDELNMIK